MLCAMTTLLWTVVLVCTTVGMHVSSLFALTSQDVGIDNGLHRVVRNLPAVRAADVIIVVAGMDGSLPSVIAGLVDSPVVQCQDCTSSLLGPPIRVSAPGMARDGQATSGLI